MKKIISLVVAVLMLLPFSAYFVSAEGPDTTSGFLSEKFKAENSYVYDADDVVRAIVITDGDPASEYGASGSDAATARTAKLNKQHSKIWASMQNKNIEYTLTAEYTKLINGFAVEAKYGDLEKIASLSGVKTVYIANTYAVPETEYETDTIGAAIATSSSVANALGYMGETMVVAIIDTGLNYNHEAFLDYGITQGGFTYYDYEEIILDGDTAPGLYISDKVPFAYDYADIDDDVTDTFGHGTHVAGIVAGYAEDDEGNTLFSGAAPAAQLAIMKVFEDGVGYTTDDTIFKALEDCYTLGVDVVNMSLGSQNGFTYDSQLADKYDNIFATLDEAGIVVCCSAGNEYNQGIASNNFVSNDYADYGTIGSPSTYSGNLSVAAACNYLEDADGNNYYYSSDIPEFGETSDQGQMADFSSWGVTSDLEFGPIISGIGEKVYSAYYENENMYVAMSGTSMACPNVAGNITLVLQYLKETQPELTKPERAERAEKLLETTASILNNGTSSYSPRKQGAGLINTLKAITTDVYLEDPVESLYDDPERSGLIEVSFTVVNNDSVDHTYYVEPEILTDTFTSIGTQIVQDSVARGSAYQFNGTDTIVVPAGSSATYTYIIELSEDFKDVLNRYNNTGVFIDGYIRLYDLEGGVDLHKSFISFYGDWTDGAIIQSLSYADFSEAYTYLVEECQLDSDTAYYFALNQFAYADTGYTYILAFNRNYLYNTLLSANLAAEDQLLHYSLDHLTFSPSDDENALFTDIAITPALLRNAEQLICVVKDTSDGEIYSVQYQDYVRKNTYNDDYDQWQCPGYFLWDGTDAYGDFLEDGTTVEISIYACLDYKSPGNLYDDDWEQMVENISSAGLTSQFSFCVTIDTEAPDYKEVSFEEGNCTFVIGDNQYLAGAVLYDAATETEIKRECYYDDVAGLDHEFVFSSSVLSSGTYCLDIIDYAANETEIYFFIDEEGSIFFFNIETGFCDAGNGEWVRDGYYSYVVVDDEEGVIDVYFPGSQLPTDLSYPMDYVTDLAVEKGYGINLWFTNELSHCISFSAEGAAYINENIKEGAASDFILRYIQSADGVNLIIDPCGLSLSSYPAGIRLYMGDIDPDYFKVFGYNMLGIIEDVDYIFDEYNGVIYFDLYEATNYEFWFISSDYYIFAKKFAERAEYYAALSELYMNFNAAFLQMNVEILQTTAGYAQMANSSAIYATEAESNAILAKEAAELAQYYAEQAASSAIAAKNGAEEILRDVTATKDEIIAANSTAIEAESSAIAAKTAAESAKAAAENAQTAAETARDAAEAFAERAEAAASSAIAANSSALEAEERAKQAQKDAEEAKSAAVAAELAAEAEKKAAEEAKSAAIAAELAAEAEKKAAEEAKSAAIAAELAAEAEKKAAEEAKTGAIAANSSALEAEEKAKQAQAAAEEAKSAAVAAELAAEAEKKAAEEAKSAAIAAELAAEAEKKAAEEARSAAIAAQTAAETEKVAAEEARSSAVAAKAAAEEAQKAAEENNSSAIAAKAAAEKAQLAAEAEKTAATAEKKAAETAKTAAEKAQTAAEAEKKAAETAKTAAETAQTAAESEKKAAETAKTAAETAQAAAEAEKKAAETAKTAAEAAQAAAEAEKKAAETAKTAAEAAQAAAEKAQADAEAKYNEIAEQQKKLQEDLDAAEKLLDEVKAESEKGCGSSISAVVIIAVMGVAYVAVRKKKD